MLILAKSKESRDFKRYEKYIYAHEVAGAKMQDKKHKMILAI
jgi:hypothetical protein